MSEEHVKLIAGQEVPSTPSGRKPRWDTNKRYKDSPSGRPGHKRRARYTKKLGKYMANQIVMGVTLRSMCMNDPEVPGLTAVMKWARDHDHHFYPLYREARRTAAELLVDDIVDIADGATKESAAADTLKVNTRKWMAANLLEEFSGEDKGAGGDVIVKVMADGKGLEGKKEGAKE